MNQKIPIAYLVTLCFLKSHENKSEANESVYWIVKDTDEDVFTKAETIGHRYSKACNDAFPSVFEFLGISEIMPVYEKPNDGIELGWRKLDETELKNISGRIIKKC